MTLGDDDVVVLSEPFEAITRPKRKKKKVLKAPGESNAMVLPQESEATDTKRRHT
jgi:hypothetical protein